jgi:DEAD/DEAH box helicase domain-containing protein
MLACFECRNLEAFVQVSSRGDARAIAQSTRGIALGSWDRSDDRRLGLYCGACGQPIDGDIDELELFDTRIDYVEPADFRAAALADEFVALRGDATWTRLTLPGCDARSGSLTAALHPALVAALARTGRASLYSHQVRAIDAALGGEQVVQATSAGSGKSLGLTMPVLHALLESRAATAMLVYPLKALANDQLNALAALGTRNDPWTSRAMFELDLGDEIEPIVVGRYDGSTLEHDKKAIRERARLFITTPDSLHASVLRMAARDYRDRSSWERILRGLRYVVLDEIHSYQGVFGSNVAQVLRRLRRAAAWHGASPRFLAASATIGNPVQLAERLTGTKPFALVDQDGSPQRPREVLICNPPPAKDQDASARRRKARAAKADDEVGEGRLAPQTIALELIASGALASAEHLPVRTICFERSRNQVSALTKRVQGRLEALQRKDLVPMVTSYAATLLSDDRESVEGSLRDGSMLAVVSTNALELGIDIPDLSLAVLCGYPGQISSFRQRAGRVGRVGEGLVVLVVGDDPLQQHLAQRPEALQELLTARAEDVVINPDAAEVVRRYGLAPGQDDVGGIAFEDAVYFGEEQVHAWLDGVTGSPAVVRDHVAYWHIEWEHDDSYAGLRSRGGNSSYTVYALSGRDREAIGVIDAATAPRDAFVGAIWAGPRGSLYRVVGFDPKLGEIYAEGPMQVGYLTRGVPVDSTAVLDPIAPIRKLGAGALGYSNLRITRWVHNYKEMSFAGGEKSKPIEKKWPPIEFDTEGVHLYLDPSWADGPWERAAAVRGLEHVLLALAPMVVACDPFDIDANNDTSSLNLYDSFGGGIGITRAVFERFDEVVALAHDTVKDCRCDKGCPGCIVLSRRPDGNKDLSKVGALAMLERLQSSMRIR